MFVCMCGHRNTILKSPGGSLMGTHGVHFSISICIRVQRSRTTRIVDRQADTQREGQTGLVQGLDFMQPETWLNRFLLSSQLMLELGDRGAGRQSGGWGKVRTSRNSETTGWAASCLWPWWCGSPKARLLYHGTKYTHLALESGRLEDPEEGAAPVGPVAPWS